METQRLEERCHQGDPEARGAALSVRSQAEQAGHLRIDHTCSPNLRKFSFVRQYMLGLCMLRFLQLIYIY